MKCTFDWLIIRGDLIYARCYLRLSSDVIDRVELVDASDERRALKGGSISSVVRRISGRLRECAQVLFYGGLGEGLADSNLCVLVRLGDSRILRFPVDQRGVTPPGVHRYLRTAARGLHHVVSALQDRDMSALLDAWRAHKTRPSELENLDPVRVLTEDFQTDLDATAVLIIDHDLGGGAELYRQSLIQRWNERTLVLLQFRLQTLQYVITVFRDGMPVVRGALRSLADIRRMFRGGMVTEVFFNNCLSFPEPLRIAELLAERCGPDHVPLSVALHDFMLACPSTYLLNCDGRFCGIPETSVCDACLPKNEFLFLGTCSSSDIIEWRSAWSRVLQRASRIIYFSDSSVSLLRRSFPEIPRSKFFKEVSRPTSGAFRRPAVDITSPLRVGVVGSIGYHKGATVIEGLARQIRAKGLDVRIVVIGTFHGTVDLNVMSTTGEYRRDQLVHLIEKTGANVMFLPSIVPETYSYVTSELIDMGLPLVCFDLGAQAERTRHYRLGRVIPLTDDPSVILGELRSFHKVAQESIASIEV